MEIVPEQCSIFSGKAAKPWRELKMRFAADDTVLSANCNLGDGDIWLHKISRSLLHDGLGIFIL